MLVLTRRPNQVIRIGDDIRIVVLGFYDDRVRLGIEAPLAVPVDREEIYARKMQKREALLVDSPASQIPKTVQRKP